jgi:ABC-type transport system involved in multi-copper enzyme maturation permease subunit
MIGKLLWKEWRENRWKYATLWLVFNAPMLILILCLALFPGARGPFADLSDRTVMKYLPLTLTEGYLLATLFLLATALVAVSVFRPDGADKAMFFVFEQPVSRRKYLASKLLYGMVQVAIAVCFAVLFAPVAAYAMMLIAGKVTTAGSAATFGIILSAAARCIPWCALFSLAAFTGAALISALVPRWWLAAVCAIVFIAAFGAYAFRDHSLFGGGEFFEIIPDVPGKSYSVSANFPDPKWLKVSDNLPMPTGYGPSRLVPLLASAVLIAIFSTGLAFVYDRKELK